ncbi:MAG: iron-sulfur cluster assembly scaffold protein, partial [Thermoflexia bacterium]
QIHLELALDEEGKVRQVAFEGEGCMVSMAAASIFTEYLRGKHLKELEQLAEEEVIALLDAPIPPSRRRCALAPLMALRAGLRAYHRR